jgi:hypothetical protein
MQVGHSNNFLPCHIITGGSSAFSFSFWRLFVSP